MSSVGDFSKDDLKKVGQVFKSMSIPIKQLIMICEMAKQMEEGSLAQRIMRGIQYYIT